MDESLKKALFTNAIIMAKADGEIEPEEKDFIKKLMTEAEITNNQAGQWLKDARENDYQLLPVQGQDHLDQLLRLMIGIAATDKKLRTSEKEILVQIGKVNGLSTEELVHALKKYWDLDNFEAIFHGPGSGTENEYHITVVSDHFTDVADFIKVCGGVHFETCDLKSIKPDMAPEWIIFHAADKKRRSLNMLDRLQSVFPESKIIGVVARAQAFQVSYLLDAGAFFCMVKPIYPNELLQRLQKEKGKRVV